MKVIKRIFVKDIGWIHGEKGNHINAYSKSEDKPQWFRHRNTEYNIKYIIAIEYGTESELLEITPF